MKTAINGHHRKISSTREIFNAIKDVFTSLAVRKASETRILGHDRSLLKKEEEIKEIEKMYDKMKAVDLNQVIRQREKAEAAKNK